MIALVFLLAFASVVLCAVHLSAATDRRVLLPVTALVLGVIAWQARRTLNQDRLPVVALEPLAGPRWRARLKGTSAELDLELLSWTQAGPILALEFENGRLHLGTRKLLIARDQCDEAGWRTLQRQLRWGSDA